MSRIIETREVEIDQIVVDPQNARQSVGAITELEDSIERLGVQSPLLLRPNGTEATYYVVAGSRRLAAARSVGLTTVPAIIKEMTDTEAAVESLVENYQRQSLEPAEQAQAFAKLVQVLGSVKDAAAACGVSKQSIESQLEANRLVGLLRAKRSPPAGGVSSPSDSIISIPSTSTTADISRAAKDLFEEDETRQVEFFEELKDKPRSQVRETIQKVRRHVAVEPTAREQPVKALVKEASKALTVDIKLRFEGAAARGLARAERERSMGPNDVARHAVEEWLKKQGLWG